MASRCKPAEVRAATGDCLRWQRRPGMRLKWCVLPPTAVGRYVTLPARIKILCSRRATTNDKGGPANVHTLRQP
jgi:hypothetical protein